MNPTYSKAEYMVKEYVFEMETFCITELLEDLNIPKLTGLKIINDMLDLDYIEYLTTVDEEQVFALTDKLILERVISYHIDAIESTLLNYGILARVVGVEQRGKDYEFTLELAKGAEIEDLLALEKIIGQNMNVNLLIKFD